MKIKGNYVYCKNKQTNQRTKVFYTVSFHFNSAVITIFAKNKQSKGYSFMMNGHTKFLSFSENKYGTIIKLQVDTTQFKSEYKFYDWVNNLFSYC